jgi:hypothetical protein
LDKSVRVKEVEREVKAEVRSVRLTWGKRVGARDLKTAGLYGSQGGLTHFGATLWEFSFVCTKS